MTPSINDGEDVILAGDHDTENMPNILRIRHEHIVKFGLTI